MQHHNHREYLITTWRNRLAKLEKLIAENAPLYGGEELAEAPSACTKWANEAGEIRQWLKSQEAVSVR